MELRTSGSRECMQSGTNDLAPCFDRLFVPAECEEAGFADRKRLFMCDARAAQRDVEDADRGAADTPFQRRARRNSAEMATIVVHVMLCNRQVGLDLRSIWADFAPCATAN